jgi:hypothetical protein
MTTIDRFDQSLADVLAELGRADASSLIEDVLARTASMGQRPAWRQPGAWFVGASAPEVRSVGRSTWIVLAVVLLMAALLAVAMAGAFGPTPPIHHADVALPSSPVPVAPETPTPAPLSVQAAEPSSSVLPSVPPLPSAGQGAISGRFTPIAGPLPDFQSMLVSLRDGRVLLDAAVSGSTGHASIWDPATGKITPTGRMQVPGRGGGAVVRLDDGRVALIGGDYAVDANGTGMPTYPTAEIFDPAAGTFTSLGRLPDPIWGFSAARLADGRILITGGVTVPGDPVRPAAASEIFDPTTNTFTRITGLTLPRAFPGVVALTDGRVLVVGGSVADASGSLPAGAYNVTGSAELYDPAAGQFIPTGSMPDFPKDTTHRWPLFSWGPVVALSDGRAMVLGLACREDHDLVDGVSAGGPANRTYVFDPRSQTFNANPAMPHCVGRALVRPNGDIFVSGWWHQDGATDERPTYSSAIATDERTWSAILDPRTGMLRRTDPPPAGQYLDLFALRDGRIIARSGDGGFFIYR